MLSDVAWGLVVPGFIALLFVIWWALDAFDKYVHRTTRKKKGGGL